MRKPGQKNKSAAPAFSIGELVEHDSSGCRGAVFAIDKVFMRSDEWYERWATKPAPRREQNWYHLLVDNAVHAGYFPEEELCSANSKNQITHPALGDYFKSFDGMRYAAFQKTNSGPI